MFELTRRLRYEFCVQTWCSALRNSDAVSLKTTLKQQSMVAVYLGVLLATMAWFRVYFFHGLYPCVPLSLFPVPFPFPVLCVCAYLPARDRPSPRPPPQASL